MATVSVSKIPACPICHESFTTPKFLPCGHTFCLTCIEQCIAARRGTFTCPLCKQKINIPEGGAMIFPTNFTVEDIMVFLNNEGQTSTSTLQHKEPRDNPQPKCPKHIEDEMSYYCLDCNIGLCSKCEFAGQHKPHETLDIGSERNTVIGKLKRSQNFIQNRIKFLKKTRSTLLESFEELKSLCEDSCTNLTEKTELTVKDIRRNLEDNRSKVEDREKEMTSEINSLEGNMELNISPSNETTLEILQTLHRLKEIEKLSESRKDYNLCLQYLQWEGEQCYLNRDQLGSVISKPFYTPGSYQFIFNVSDVKEYCIIYSKYKFRNNNLVWSCGVNLKGNNGILVAIKLAPDDNPKLNYCIIDYETSLLNTEYRTDLFGKIDRRFDKKTEFIGMKYPITLSTLADKKKGYSNSNNQFVVQCDIQHIREISWM